jgi:hypothetical protein
MCFHDGSKYQESIFAAMEERARYRHFLRLKRQAAALGFRLAPTESVP